MKKWYQTAYQYWQKAALDYNGMLSGFGQYSDIDIESSKNFLDNIIEQHNISRQTAIDCGAGIGRITKQLLQYYYRKISLVDQSENLIAQAQKNLKGINIQKLYVSNLKIFEFQQKYDCIWIQWVLLHLLDKDAVEFLQKAKNNLTEKGIIIVKQNQLDEYSAQSQIDPQDSSYVRSQQLHKKIFQRAGLRIISDKLVAKWPQYLYKVHMYALV